MSRGWRLAITIGVTVVVLAPMFRPGTPDSFPLSTFPMFSTSRPAVMSVDTAVGRTAADERVRLSPEEISGTYEVVLAGATVSRAVAGGDATAARLCAEIAERVSDTELDRVEVVTERLDTIAVVRSGADPESVIVHAECAVATSAGSS